MKKMFYYTDVLPFLSRKEVAIEKLKRNLEIFKGVDQDIHLVWHPWSKTAEYLELNRSKVTEEYNKVLRQFVDEGWGELDETGTFQEAKEVMLGCDAYYGDVSDLAYEAQIAKKPVMLQNFDI